MKIGIDFHSAEQEGSGNCTYIRNLAETLCDRYRDDEFFLYITDPALPYFRCFEGLGHVRLRPLAGRHALRRIPSLGLRADGDGVEVLHVQYVAPPFFRGKVVVTVHDLAFLAVPGFFTFWKRAYLTTLVPLSLKRAARVITVSDYSRSDLISRYRLPEGLIRRTYEAADPRFHPLGLGQGRRSIKERYGLEGPYILYVGRLDARKNLAGLIEAFALLKRGPRVPHKLVIAGAGNSASGVLQRRIAAQGLCSEVILTGYVPESDLPALYSQADVFVYPSEFEGFGLPVLEAMASGCPVVVSASAALPEVVGRGGLVAGSIRPGPLSQAISRVIGDRAFRSELVQKGLARAREFSWARTADQTMEVYLQARNSSR